MEFPKILDFSQVEEKINYPAGTEEYDALMDINENGLWNEYANEMLSVGIVVRFDDGSDTFEVKPSKVPTLNEAYLLDNEEDEVEGEESADDDIDIEINDEELSNIMDPNKNYNDEENMDIDDDGQENFPPPPEKAEPELDGTPVLQPTVDPPMTGGSISLEDIMALLKQTIPGLDMLENNDDLANSPDPELKSDDTSLQQSYFQGDGKETLDSEFPALDDKIQNIKNIVDSGESYIKTIDGLPTELKSMQDMQSNELQVPETDGPSAPDVAKDLGYEGEDDCEDTEQGGEQLLLDTDGEPAEDEEEDENELHEDMTGAHPDLRRIVGEIEPTDEDLMPQESTFDAEDISMEEPMNMNGTMEVGGQPVRIVLTGVMITESEIKYISDVANQNNKRLKEIRGKGKELNIVVEGYGKTYTINYIDMPKNKLAKPFSIKSHQFGSLEEAISRIDAKKNMFSRMLDETLSKRGLNDFKESNIFEDTKNNNYVSGWNVTAAGAVNLKTGLNEVYSKITMHSNEPNTLVKINESFYLLKGNLKERSKIGTVKEFVDVKNRKSYGIGEVVGIYENSEKGLGQIMYDIKRTSIPLLVWK